MTNANVVKLAECLAMVRLMTALGMRLPPELPGLVAKLEAAIEAQKSK